MKEKITVCNSQLTFTIVMNFDNEELKVEPEAVQTEEQKIPDLQQNKNTLKFDTRNDEIYHDLECKSYDFNYKSLQGIYSRLCYRAVYFEDYTRNDSNQRWEIWFFNLLKSPLNYSSRFVD